MRSTSSLRLFGEVSKNFDNDREIRHVPNERGGKRQYFGNPADTGPPTTNTYENNSHRYAGYHRPISVHLNSFSTVVLSDLHHQPRNGLHQPEYLPVSACCSDNSARPLLCHANHRQWISEQLGWLCCSANGRTLEFFRKLGTKPITDSILSSLAMPFPDTPATLIGRLKRHDMPRLWEASWEEFFDLYHGAIRVCVHGAFQRQNWHDVTDQDVQHVVLSVFESIFQGDASIEPDAAKGRFRQFLTTVASRRVVDFIRNRNRFRSEESWEETTEAAEASLHLSATEAFRDQESRAFKTALMGTLLAALRAEVSPQVYMIFELVKLIGESPESVAEQMHVNRTVVDNSVFKAKRKLQEILQRPDIQEEFNL